MHHLSTSQIDVPELNPVDGCRCFPTELIPEASLVVSSEFWKSVPTWVGSEGRSWPMPFITVN